MIRHFLSFVFALTVFAAAAQDVNTLSGTITDDQGQPVVRATVRLLNTNLGAITDATGKFSVEGLQSGRFVLQITAIGYATRTASVNVGKEETPLTLALSESSTQLD
ncbi:MAG TPA: carboxypeptidase-like regulatory domain-containing protein, partial [Chryseolinea sp.]|nr:carboxypeptidase-like regulatory domain-containing protein [Chryseolinea sp.]